MKTQLYLHLKGPNKWQLIGDSHSFLRLDNGGSGVKRAGPPHHDEWRPVADWMLGNWNEDPFDLS